MRTSTPRDRWFCHGKQVAGELSFGQDDAVTRLPRPAFGDKIDPRRRVGHHADLGRFAGQKLGELTAKMLDSRGPLRPNRVAHAGGFVGKVRMAAAAGPLSGATAA